MATKKISDLTLRSDFDETCLIPVDDATQSWRVTGAQIQSFLAPTAPTVQKFTSGSGTYTTPAGVLYIRVRAVGGGGGGQGSGTSAGGAGGTGGNTTFGTALIVANGAAGQVGGSASLGTGPVGVAYTGGSASGTQHYQNTSGLSTGACGASSPFGGQGKGSYSSNVGGDGIANTGSGGGGSGCNAASGMVYGGAGGGAGGYVDAIITSPSATYSYAVGAAGTAGAAGTSGVAGGAGGSGVIVVEEFYQ